MPEEEIEPETQHVAEPVKRQLPLGRLVMLSTVLFYVGYNYAVNEGFGVPLLLEAGLDERYAPFVFGISSLINVILGGYLGSSSDRCTSSLGRRRPYIIGLTILLLVGMILYPNGDVLSDAFQLKHNDRKIYLITHITICVIVVDISSDLIHTLGRSYLFDSITIQQSSKGNAIFSFMMGAGSLVGSLLSAVNWKSVLHLSNGSQTKVVFGTALVITLIGTILTLTSVKEPRVRKDGKLDYMQYISERRKYLCCNYFAFNLYVAHEINTSIQNKEVSQTEETEPLPPKTSLQQNRNHKNVWKSPWYLFMQTYRRIQDSLYFITSLSTPVLWLWLAQVLEWIATISLLFLITNFVAIFIYNGTPDADTNSKEKEDYDKGLQMGFYCKCIGFGSSLFFSVFLYSKYSYRFYTRASHIFIHVLTFLAAGVLIFNKSIYLVASLHVIFGCFYSWNLIIPLTILQHYKVSFVYYIVNYIASYFIS